MSDPAVSTSKAISPDSGEHWSAPGAWEVAPGLHRIPLPLPMDGLRAVNVYVLESEEGLTLVDGGWAITEGRAALEAGLKQIGRGFGDIRRFLVTHVHRDHYSLAATLGTEFGAEVTLGIGEKPTMDMLFEPEDATGPNMIDQLRAAGAHDIAAEFETFDADDGRDDRSHRYPDTWLTGDQQIAVGERVLDAVHTPGHTQGHFVFADQSAGLLFAGDHVLPTITPSIGFEPAVVDQPLRDFMDSLTRVRQLPDLRLLPAHGPIAPSTYARIDELLAHHEERLDLCLRSLEGSAPKTSLDVAGDLPWTRHEHRFSQLDVFNGALAVMETKAHLELLVARGQASRTLTPDGVTFSALR
ncbi:MBL fold metallo-hydrolase [Nocardioides sp. Kera G14]|uniref:MBL fold metallo-hydrolase n=1 Tax=Nocardioides sp. Kera G14 TaxID=2884264 RepID=UPI001D0FF4EF|nr:MBL fold metallo-hydrolase [Nocardioides sp. Kera G14]UDY23833.1 MBL fold metallo-hydrolase [Nocardioides sp. Kera G14]